jgi:signal transduction histidine kinase
MTLADEHGELLLHDFDGLVGNSCINDIKHFSQINFNKEKAHYTEIYIHPNPQGYHFDIMQHWGKNKMTLFVSFKLNRIMQLLKGRQLTDNQLILIKHLAENSIKEKRKERLIELTTKGSRYILNNLGKGIYLTAEDVQRIKVERAVKGTFWDLVDLPDKGVLEAKIMKIYLENLLIFLFFMSVCFFMLVLLIISYKKNMNAQVQLIQGAKMASLGEMVGGITHEMNTPLGSIHSNTEMLEDKLTQLKELIIGEDKKLITDCLTLSQINLRGIEKISELVQGLKNFSYLDQKQYGLFDIHQGLEDTLLILAYKLTNTIHITKYWEHIPSIHCVPSQINQVFLNLFQNAIQAIKDKEEDKELGEICITTGVANEQYIYIRIEDNGIGIELKNRNKIFDPFYSTRAIGKGTGLGLAIVYRIIQQHKGKIQVESKVGRKTVFTLYLPI